MHDYCDSYSSYDHRIKDLIIKTKDPSLFSELNIPSSTTSAWMRKRKVNSVITLELFKEEKDNLIVEHIFIIV